MIKTLLQPDLVLGSDVLALTPALLQAHGLRGLVLDVDETLVPLRQQEVPAVLQTWIQEIRPVATVWLASNNVSAARIQKIGRALDVPFVYGAAKPSRRKLWQILKAMNLPPQQVAMVGDRLFTDVVVGNRLGMFTILVEPMTTGGKSKLLWRNLEAWISQSLGVSLPGKQNFTEAHNSTSSEI